MATNKDSSNIFTTETEQSQYWEDYLTARPDYTKNDFYARVLEYHRSHQDGLSSGRTTAHDVGSGPGQVAAVLSGHFDFVVASDLNESHLAIAKERLARSLDSTALGKISFERLAAEEVHYGHPPGSAAFIAVGEAMPLLDPAKAFESWSTLLQSGGTLAIWFYGRPHFTHGEGYDAEKCQKIYDQIADAMFAKYSRGGGPARQAGWKRATDCMSSFLDNVDYDPARWKDVTRLKWNSDLEMSFYGPKACDFDIDIISRIRSQERVELIDEPGFWGKSWKTDDWKQFLKMNLPAFKQEDITPDIETLWTQLGKLMGGPDAQHEVKWPVVAILATKV